MNDCNSAETPSFTAPSGKDEDRDPFNNKWEYSVVEGMLVYLITNSRPDLAYLVWGSEDEQDPVCVKYRTSFYILFMG